MPTTPPPPPPSAVQADPQDLANQLLAGALQAAAALHQTRHAAALLATREPQAAAHLAAAATAWAQTRDAMMQAADHLTARRPL